MPAGVAQMARKLGKPVFAIVGQATDELEVRELFDKIYSLNDQSEGFRQTPRLLESRARELASQLR